jgi:hypothetical protein
VKVALVIHFINVYKSVNVLLVCLSHRKFVHIGGVFIITANVRDLCVVLCISQRTLMAAVPNGCLPNAKIAHDGNNWVEMVMLFASPSAIGIVAI